MPACMYNNYNLLFYTCVIKRIRSNKRITLTNKRMRLLSRVYGIWQNNELEIFLGRATKVAIHRLECVYFTPKSHTLMACNTTSHLL